MKIIIINNKCKITDITDPKIINIIAKECSFKIKGAEFSDLYKQGRWDGFKRLYNRQTNTFPVGLLDRIVGLLDQHDVEYSLRDERVFPEGQSININISGPPIRPYQEEAKEKAIKYKMGIIQVATGGGKTYIAANIIAEIGKSTLFMVHTKDLLYQAKREFEEMMNIHIGQIGDGVIDIQPITVATMQTISRALGKNYKDTDEDISKEKPITLTTKNKQAILNKLDETQVVVWDEVHRVACDMAMGVSDAIKFAQYRIGLSASPWRDDNADLMIEAAIGRIIYKISASELIQLGYLVPPIIKMERIKAILPYGTYEQLYKINIVENEYRNMRILYHVEKLMEQNIPTLIIVKRIKHGKILQKLIRENFGPVDFLSGNDSSEVRNRVIGEFREGQKQLLIASTIADEGLDIKRLGAIILAGSGKSSTRALQRVGRAIRTYNNKDHAIIIDFIDQCQYLHQHAMERKAIYQSEEEFIILETN